MILLAISARNLKIVREILAQHIPQYDVYAFGSRVGGKAGKGSDLDLAVMTDKPLETACMADLREAFSESELPFKVDILDWAATGDNFKKNFLQAKSKIQNGKKSCNAS